MDFVLIRFIEKWLEEGRFPREELKARWWILALGALTVGALAAALALAALD